MKTLPVGLQVYTVRDFAERDFKGTMLKLKDMGYDYVELAGMYGISPTEIHSILDDVGLKAISAHVALAEFKDNASAVVDDYVTAGCKYIAIPYLSDELRPGQPNFNDVLSEMARIGQICNDKGITLLYHNHDFEFVRMPDGSYGFDYIYSHVPPEFLETEIDTCWVKVAGECPAAYIKKYAGRCPIVHLKDFKGEKTANMYELIGIEKKAAASAEEFAFRPVGYGVQNFPSILEASVESGALYVVVEQDRSDDCDSLEAAKKSRDYLKSIGW